MDKAAMLNSEHFMTAIPKLLNSNETAVQLLGTIQQVLVAAFL